MRRYRSDLLAVSAGLTLVGLAAAGCSKSGADAKDTNTVKITLTSDGCKPSPDNVKAGTIKFRVTNSGAGKVSEAELMKDKVIAGEKENLTPGLSGSFSLKLKAGRYKVYCPNAKQENWDFKVTGTANESTADPQLKKALDAATTGYQQYVVGEVAQVVTGTRSFTDAVRSGDIEKAKSLFATARYHYETIEPVAESFGDLDPAIDARIDDVASESRWTGFHRIEKALWQDRSLAGMAPVADKLDTDVAKLQQLVARNSYQPAQLANGATELLNEVGAKKVTGEEDRYSHTDLSDFEANVQGAKKAYELLAPALKRVAPDLASTVDQKFADVLGALQPYQQAGAAGGWADYSTVDQDKRRVLAQKVDALAEPLSQVAAKVTV